MDMQIKLAAEEFVRIVHSSEVMKKFRTAQERFTNDPEVIKRRNEFNTFSHVVQQKQYSTELTQEEIDRYKSAKRALSSHPAVEQYTKSRQELIEILQSCNESMSQILGFDFAATAAPAASC